MSKKRRSFSTKKKIASKIDAELTAYIQEHKNQILTYAREDLGNNVSNKKIYAMFRSNFKERLAQSSDPYSIINARKAMKRTLHSETFTSKEIIDYENLRSSMIKDKSWDEFRKLNRHQKVIPTNFKQVKAPTGVRTRWEYNTDSGKTIQIDLIYHDDGTYEHYVHWATPLTK